ncbi:DUF3099 domain-containing protein [Microbacterium marinilacus]|uniref:DUF3099 domain-containing protein n=1 Tax=Microbacterium marinilacus TaxID=415209 RepID=A0ABP7BJP8_9MICO|nr:DUF3099 domain-containing protein [Microbacterium marinilacus]MBY0688507.1 DUF3099 domain-containing protein [Microbacterium marinilacus]
MKTPRKDAPAAQSATSLPIAPADDAGDRVRNYLLTMGIRIACLVLMVCIQPYGWYSIVFAVGAVFLPYFAVVGANAASGRTVSVAQSPETAIEDRPAEPEQHRAEPHSVIRIAETSATTPTRSPQADTPAAGGDGHGKPDAPPATPGDAGRRVDGPDAA